VTAVEVLTDPAVTATLPVVASAATVTFAGTGKIVGSELDNETNTPPAAAGPFRVTVTVLFLPLTTDAGAREIADRAVGVTVSTAVLFTPAYAAPTVTGVEALTQPAVTTTLPVVAPAAIGRLAGTGKIVVFELDNEINTPPTGAGPVSLTVTVLLFALTTDVGESAMDNNAGGFTVKVPLRTLMPSVAEIDTGVALVTAVVEALNVASLEPAGTTTEEGVETTVVFELPIETL